MLGLGLGLNRSAFINGIDPQAKATYDYIIADGGIVPAGLKALSDMFKLVKAYRGVNDITQAIKSWHHPHYGIKLASGTGATASNRACSKVYNLVNPTNAATQATPANQPLALVFTGTNYVWLPGVSGNYFSTPNATANDLSGNMTIDAYVNPLVLTGSKTICAKYSGATATNQFVFELNGAALRITITIAGVDTAYTSSANVPFSANQSFYVRVTRNSTTGNILFYTSADGVTFTQLGVTRVGLIGSLTVANRIIEVGSIISGASNQYQGIVNWVKLYKDDTATTVTQYFNPANFSRATSQTQWTSSTSEVWTINVGSATTGLKAVICDITMIIGNGTSYMLTNNDLNINEAAFTNHTVFRKYNNTVLSIFNELGNDGTTVAGFYRSLNAGAPNTEGFGAFANIGNNSTVFDSNITLMKISSADWDSSRPNPESLYYINNSAATVNSAGGSSNNTANMNATGYNLLGRNGGSLLANGVLTCDMIVSGVDTPTQRTNMYNILKTQFNL